MSAESGDIEAQEYQRQGASCTESLGCDSGDISGEVQSLNNSKSVFTRFSSVGGRALIPADATSNILAKLV